MRGVAGGEGAHCFEEGAAVTSSEGTADIGVHAAAAPLYVAEDVYGCSRPATADTTQSRSAKGRTALAQTGTHDRRLCFQ